MTSHTGRNAARAALRQRCDASADRWLLEVLAISYTDPDAKTADGKPVTRLTFGEKVRALELQSAPWVPERAARGPRDRGRAHPHRASAD